MAVPMKSDEMNKAALKIFFSKYFLLILKAIAFVVVLSSVCSPYSFLVVGDQ